MAEKQDPHSQHEYAFRAVELFKNHTLGTGSYGAVCKAKCDQLLCAAKLLYPVLFQIQAPDPGKEHRHPSRRFETECQFLSHINHPNIVQYLGTYRDPETDAPVLLMELMDESLTHFLESLLGDLPYHTQINISHDIAQALAFLHANGIIHRDLSSNNVLLLLANTRAKVTDFGMSKFTALDTTQLATMTMCPGTPVFMSPEALNEPPVYTDKLDNFSFGVLLVQITTRQFPKPTDRFKMRELLDPELENQAIRVNVPVPELERRQAHIDLISSDHPLLPTALRCLKDEENERPTATQLCEILTALKKMDSYQESSQQDLHRLLRERDTQLQAKQEQLVANQQTIAHINELLAINEDTLEHRNEQILEYQETVTEKDEQLLEKKSENDELATRLDMATKEIDTLQHEARARETQLTILYYDLLSSEKSYNTLQQTIEKRDKEITELRQALASKNEIEVQMNHIALQDERRATLTTPVRVKNWQALPDVPIAMWYGSSAVIGDKAYFKSDENKAVYEFSNDNWREFSLCPKSNCTLVSVCDVLTAVGGRSYMVPRSNKLFSYINNWVEQYPPMPSGRRNPAAVYINNILVVAGGHTINQSTTVEILNTVTMQWSCVSSLPLAIDYPSAINRGNYVYIHPRSQEKNLVYMCSLEQLIQSQPHSDIWEETSLLPVNNSSLITIDDKVLAVGGQDPDRYRSTSIYWYKNTSWISAGKMILPRSAPITAALPGNKLMVVGGAGGLKKCEIADVV